MKTNSKNSIINRISILLTFMVSIIATSANAITLSFNNDVGICSVITNTCTQAENAGMDVLPVEFINGYLVNYQEVIVNVNGGIWMMEGDELTIGDGYSLSLNANGSNDQIWFLKNSSIDVGVNSNLFVKAKGYLEIEPGAAIAGQTGSRILLQSDYKVAIKGALNSSLGEYIALLSKTWVSVEGSMFAGAKTIIASNYRDNGWAFDDYYNAGNITPLLTNNGVTPYVQSSSSDTLTISGNILQLGGSEELNLVSGGDIKLSSSAVITAYNNRTQVLATGWFHQYGRLVTNYPVVAFAQAPDVTIEARYWYMGSNAALGGRADQFDVDASTYISLRGSIDYTVDNANIASPSVYINNTSAKFTTQEDNSTFLLVTDKLELTNSGTTPELKLVNFGGDRDANFYTSLTRRHNAQLVIKTLVNNGNGKITLETTDTYPEVVSNGYEGADLTISYGQGQSASGIRAATNTIAVEMPISANIYFIAIDNSASFYDTKASFITSNIVETTTGTGQQSSSGDYFTFSSNRGTFYIESSDF